MSAKRVEMDRLIELVRLHRMGEGSREVCRLLAMSPKTELRYRSALRTAGLLDGPVDALPDSEAIGTALSSVLPAGKTREVKSSVDRWMDEIRGAVDGGVRPKALCDRLVRTENGFRGSYQAIKRAYARVARARGVQAEDVVIPVETPAGEVGQVDFGYVGRLFDPEAGRLRKAWVFLLVLGFSRHMFAQVVFDQKTATWIQLHVDAFSYLGGVPRVIVPDNLKAAVVRTAFGLTDRSKLALNRSYRELARFYRFKIDPTPPRSPKKKGKVESGVRYVKQNFFASTELEDIDHANRELADWVEKTAGRRTHGTTGRQPLAYFLEEESQALTPLPVNRFEVVVWKIAKVHRDSHVEFERRLYSVPWRHVGQQVLIRATKSSVEIHADNTRIATHERLTRGRRSTHERHLPEHRVDLRHRCEGYWLERADRIGDDVGRYVRAVFESDDVLSKLRDAQAIVSLLEGYPPHRAARAAQRALYYGNFTYQGIRRILRNALNLRELPTVLVQDQSGIEQPRFARSVHELLATKLELPNEPN